MRTFATLLASAWAVFGCSSPEAADRASRPVSRAAVRFLVDASSPVEAIAYADARFVRYRHVDDETADRLLGVGDRSLLHIDRCRIEEDEPDLDEALASLPPTASLAALDAGDLRVETGGEQIVLRASERAALYPYVAGSEYDVAMVERTGASVRVNAEGSRDIGAFEVAAPIAAAPAELTIARSDSGIEVRWTAGARGDEVDVVIAFDSGVALRCRTPDDGQVDVSARVLSAGDPALWVAIERWHVAPFSARGVDSAALEVGVRRVVSAGTEE